MANGFAWGVGGCHCGACETVGHCVTIEWDLEYLDFFIGCSTPRVFFPASGSATFYFDPDDPSLSKLVCLNGTPVTDDTDYKTPSTGAQSWTLPSGASGAIVISGGINISNVCFGVQVLLTSEFGAGHEWAGLVSNEATEDEKYEDLTGTGDCGADEITIRGTITMTDNWPSTAEACGCP